MTNTDKNIHAHIFTMDNAPKKFLELFLPGFAADAVNAITNTRVGASALVGFISLFGSGGQRYARFLKIGKSATQTTVFEQLMDSYSDQSIELTALVINMDFLGAGETSSGFYGQLDDIVKIKQRYADRLLVFFGLDPRWVPANGRSIRQEVERYFETKVEAAGKMIYPFAGIKIYPSTGYYVFDPRLKETFEWAADNGVPILSHNNYLGGIFNYDEQHIQSTLNTVFNPYTNRVYAEPKYMDTPSARFNLIGKKQRARLQNNCSFFMEPSTYIPVMDHFEKLGKSLKINLAHFGGTDQMMETESSSGDPEQITPYGVTGKNWYLQICEMIRTYKGAYTDISYDVAQAAKSKNNNIFKKFTSDMNDPSLSNRIMFGTDFFMSERESNEENTYNKFKTYASGITLNSGENMWTKMARTNTNNFLQSKYYQ